MYQKDYILRMIEMLVDLIAHILGLIKKGDFEKATHALENAYHDFLKQDAAFFRRIPKEDLTDKLLSEHHFTNGNLEMLSELFFAQAELFNAQGKNTESIEFYEKSLILINFIEKDSKTYSVEKQSRMALIQGQITRLIN